MSEKITNVPATPGARRILVVDDNADAAQTMAMLLQLQGYAVEIAYDGKDALEQATASKPDVMLLDIGLPGMNGYALAERLRERPETRDAVLIALTGYGQRADQQRSQEAGFNHHLVKPVDPDLLFRLLATQPQQVT